MEISLEDNQPCTAKKPSKHTCRYAEAASCKAELLRAAGLGGGVGDCRGSGAAAVDAQPLAIVEYRTGGLWSERYGGWKCCRERVHNSYGIT